MDAKHVPAIFEAGKLRPLVPLDLNEQERVEITVTRTVAPGGSDEDEYVPAVVADADPKVSLEQVQQALAKIPGSLVDDFSRDRDERF